MFRIVLIGIGYVEGRGYKFFFNLGGESGVRGLEVKILLGDE